MVKHGMNMQLKATAHLNPGQIPVTTFDQSLFAIAKFVQMELAFSSWRNQARCDAWRIAPRDSSMECMW